MGVTENKKSWRSTSGGLGGKYMWLFEYSVTWGLE